MGAADFSQIMRLRNQLVVSAENFVTEKNLSPMLTPTMSKDVDEQLKLAHKVIHVLDRAKRKICVTLLRHNVEKPEISNAQVRFFAKRKEHEKLQQIADVIYKLDEFICLFDKTNSVCDKVITNERICNIL